MPKWWKGINNGYSTFWFGRFTIHNCLFLRAYFLALLQKKQLRPCLLKLTLTSKSIIRIVCMHVALYILNGNNWVKQYNGIFKACQMMKRHQQWLFNFLIWQVRLSQLSVFTCLIFSFVTKETAEGLVR